MKSRTVFFNKTCKLGSIPSNTLCKLSHSSRCFYSTVISPSPNLKDLNGPPIKTKYYCHILFNIEWIIKLIRALLRLYWPAGPYELLSGWFITLRGIHMSDCLYWNRNKRGTELLNINNITLDIPILWIFSNCW